MIPPAPFFLEAGSAGPTLPHGWGHRPHSRAATPARAGAPVGAELFSEEGDEEFPMARWWGTGRKRGEPVWGVGPTGAPALDFAPLFFPHFRLSPSHPHPHPLFKLLFPSLVV